MVTAPPSQQKKKGSKLTLAALLASAVLWGSSLPTMAEIVNSVVASGNYGSTTIGATASEEVDVVDEISTLTLEKLSTFNDANNNGSADVGETISYTFTAINTGNVTLTNVTLTDDKVTATDLALFSDVGPQNDSSDTAAVGWASLAPGDVLRATATYTIQPVDLDAGQVTNNARIDATTVSGAPVSATDSVITPFSTLSSMTLEKTGTLNLANGVADVGDIITYQFTVTNTGPTTLRNVSVSDPLIIASLPESNGLQNLIQVASIPSDPITTASIPAPTLESLGITVRPPRAKVPEIQSALHAERRLIRLTAADEAFKAGDSIGVYFKLTNAGAGPLTSISVRQPSSIAFADSLDILAPNSTDASSILLTHVLTDEDVQTGQIDLTSTITARSRNKTLVQTLRGTMSLLDVDTSDDIATASITPTVIPTLAPGASTTFTATYPITQADIDAGERLNTAEASATNVTNVVLREEDSAAVAIPQAPAIALQKSGVLNLGADNEASVGDIITYSFVMTNTGNTTLDDVRLADTTLPGINITFTEFDNFAPGDEQTFTGTYALTLADIEAGSIDNQATASGLPRSQTGRISAPSNDPATPAVNDVTTIDIPQAPKIALIKTVGNVADTNGNGITDVGDTVTYRFSVRNAGNVPLTNVFVRDRDPDVVSNLLPPTGITLAVGEENTTTFTATYVLQQPDADRGYYDNTADVYGTAPDNTVVEDESDPAVYLNDAPTRVVIPPQPALAVLKPQPTVIDNNGNSITDLGDRLDYTITVTNTGNVTLSNVVVTDLKDTNFSVTIPSLAPGAVFARSVPFSYIITAADMTAGRVENTAVASSSYNSTPVDDQSDPTDLTRDNPTITPIVPRPAVALVKPQPDINDVNNNGITDVGDQLIYRFAVTNTGNVNLTTITFTDTLPGVFAGTRATPLQAGETDSTTFTFTYTLTAADVLLGAVTNSADVLARSPTNVQVRDTSDFATNTGSAPTVTNLATLLAPGISVLKQAATVDSNTNGILDVGDRINYTFVVTNTGNVDLTNVSVTDAKLAGEGTVISPNAGVIGNLPRGATNSTMTSFHVITQADVDAGAYENQARVDGNFRSVPVSDLSDPVSPTGGSQTVVSLTQLPALAVIKPQPTNNDANGNGRIDEGDTLTYSFEIRNVGNVTLYDVALTDTFAPISATILPIPVLAPGAVDSTRYTATYLVTEADAIAGSIVNQATVRGARTNGGPLTVEDLSDSASVTGNEPTVTLVTIVPPILTKTAARSTVRRGERVEYTITATELGRGPYDIADIMPPGFSFVAGSATVNGAASAPAQSGKTLTFANISPVARKITVKLSLIASASNSTGDFINRARIYANASGQLLAEAQARVTIKEEHVFDCGEIIGRVFDDANNNGYMDDGEVGLPGVRVATVKGLLVTTDKHGRFHVTCADVPNGQIGSNFLMKLDPRTLPAGYALTSENPRDVRLTRGKITKLNFGASRRCNVALDLTKDAFGKGLDLKSKFASGLDRLVSLQKQCKGQLTMTYRCGVYAPIADERLDAVEELLQTKWEQEGGNKPLKITKRVECGK